MALTQRRLQATAPASRPDCRAADLPASIHHRLCLRRRLCLLRRCCRPLPLHRPISTKSCFVLLPALDEHSALYLCLALYSRRPTSTQTPHPLAFCCPLQAGACLCRTAAGRAAGTRWQATCSASRLPVPLKLLLLLYEVFSATSRAAGPCGGEPAPVQCRAGTVAMFWRRCVRHAPP